MDKSKEIRDYITTPLYYEAYLTIFRVYEGL